MISHLRLALLGATALVAMSGGAFAQNPPSPPGPPLPPLQRAPAAMGQAPTATAQPPLYDPQQLPAFRGQVQQFTLTPRGDIDGLILTDGTEVKTPPHLSTELAYSVKPGDTVTVHGLRAAALPLVQATSVTDEANRQTVVDNGPPGPGGKGRRPLPPSFGPAGPGASSQAGLSEVQGRVRMALHGPRGDVNGALLDDGTIIRLPPPEAARFWSLLQPGQIIVAEGVGQSGPIGKMLDVRQLGPSRDQLSTVQERGPGRGPGPRG